MNPASWLTNLAVAAPSHGGEANLVLPDLTSEKFLGVTGHNLLLVGILVSALGAAVQSTLFEYTVEGTVERPSLQDLISTPVVGTALGIVLDNRLLIVAGALLAGATVLPG